MRMKGSRVGRVGTTLMSCMGGNVRNDSCTLRKDAHYERGEGS